MTTENIAKRLIKTRARIIIFCDGSLDNPFKGPQHTNAKSAVPTYHGPFIILCKRESIGFFLCEVLCPCVLSHQQTAAQVLH